MEGLDDAIKRRGNGGGIQCHDFCRGQCRLAYREEADDRKSCPDGVALAAQTLPAFAQAQPGFATQHFPAVAP